MPVGGKYLLPREGKIILLLLLLMAAICWYQAAWLVSSGIVLFAVFLTFLFRQRLTKVPSAPLAIVSPIDGVIVAIENTTDPWLKRDAIKVRIKMGYLDVHTIRSPIEGKIQDLWRDKFLGKFSGRRYTCWIQTDEQDDVVMSFCLGAAAPFVKTNFTTGQRVGQGHPAGFLYLSGLVELYLPNNTNHDLKVGQRLQAGADILGQFVHD